MYSSHCNYFHLIHSPSDLSLFNITICLPGIPLSSLWSDCLTPVRPHMTNDMDRLTAQRRWTNSLDDEMEKRCVTPARLLICRHRPHVKLFCRWLQLQHTQTCTESISALKPPQRCHEICLQPNLTHLSHSLPPLKILQIV